MYNAVSKTQSYIVSKPTQVQQQQQQQQHQSQLEQQQQQLSSNQLSSNQAAEGFTVAGIQEPILSSPTTSQPPPVRLESHCMGLDGRLTQVVNIEAISETVSQGTLGDTAQLICLTSNQQSSQSCQETPILAPVPVQAAASSSLASDPTTSQSQIGPGVRVGTTKRHHEKSTTRGGLITVIEPTERQHIQRGTGVVGQPSKAEVLNLGIHSVRASERPGIVCGEQTDNRNELYDEYEDEDDEDEEFNYEPVLAKILNEKKLALSFSPEVIEFFGKLSKREHQRNSPGTNDNNKDLELND